MFNGFNVFGPLVFYFGSWVKFLVQFLKNRALLD